MKSLIFQKKYSSTDSLLGVVRRCISTGMQFVAVRHKYDYEWYKGKKSGWPGIIQYTEWHKKRELLKNLTKIEEFQEKKLTEIEPLQLAF